MTSDHERLLADAQAAYAHASAEAVERLHERDTAIADALRAGVSGARVAALANVTEGRVSQIKRMSALYAARPHRESRA